MGEHGGLLPKQSLMAEDVPQKGWHPREGPNKIPDAAANGILKGSDQPIPARTPGEGSRHDPAPDLDTTVVSHLVASPNAGLDAAVEYEHGSTAICTTTCPFNQVAKFRYPLVYVTSAAFGQRIHLDGFPRPSRRQRKWTGRDNATNQRTPTEIDPHIGRQISIRSWYVKRQTEALIEQEKDLDFRRGHPYQALQKLREGPWDAPERAERHWRSNEIVLKLI